MFNIPVVNGIGSGLITLPAGSDRTITVRAFDGKGIETHRGETIIDVVPGDNPTVTITLFPLEGIVPIIVSIGSLVVTVEPTEAEVPQRDMVQLTAVVTDADGNTLERQATWGSSNPVLASVNSDGLVTAHRIGDVEIVAQAV